INHDGLLTCRSLSATVFVYLLDRPPPGVSLVSLQSREKPRGCAGCNGKIRDRFMLQALDRYWHEDCLKCACCDCHLGRMGSTLYTRANLILCRRDYLR
ncbi:LIM domain only protein 3-like, partial [Seriola lalandi dorsalis]|uniref:LIM domain only protein 3-like n=1 Tax=Seriola lalandi dorsalis TaxID=1841481 RepID=UPI000C6F7FB1